MAVTDETIARLLSKAFPSGNPTVVGHRDAGGGRGVFSTVVRADLTWSESDGPDSVIVKLPAEGPNRDAAMRSGAYRREAQAYRQLLPLGSVRYPHAHLVEVSGEEASFVLEDLGRYRAVDQVFGLGADDAIAVATALAIFHRAWEARPELGSLDLRRATPTTMTADSLHAGLRTLGERWADAVDEQLRHTFEQLVAARAMVVDRFAKAGRPTLCHGDPRADNLVFDEDGQTIFFDWQQTAIQFGTADLAWLAATSMPIDIRRAADSDLLEAHGSSLDDYRSALALPGLAVLLLAQRQTIDDRSTRFIATSLNRIGTALSDYDVS